MTVEDWRRVQTINAEAIFFLCQKIGPRMRPGGAIVNLSSSSAKLATTIEVAAYAASKTTILSITRSFAYALAVAAGAGQRDLPGHRRHADAGGGARRVAAMRGTTAERTERRAQQDRCRSAAPPSPEECAGLIWFLLSDESAYMTGQAINFTGGLVMW